MKDYSDLYKKIEKTALASGFDVAGALLTFQTQLRVNHWQTTSYAQHIAFGSAYEALDELIDEFVEVGQGKYGRFLLKGTETISLTNLSNPVETINNFIQFLTFTLPNSFAPTDTELLNIRDEMLSVVNKLKYLLTLN